MAEGIALDKKVGPLPMGVWIAVVLGGLTVGYFINKKSSSGSTPQEQQLTETGVGKGGVAWTEVGPTPAPVAQEETNQTWGRKVVNFYVAQGYDAGLVDNTVRKYLYGQDLTFAEQSIINLALLRFGVPPEPLPPVKIPEPPPTPPSVIPAPGTPKNVVVTAKNDTQAWFAWTPVIGATSYKMRETEAGNWHDTNGLPNFAYGYLTPGKTYTWVVVAYNSSGESAPATITATMNGAAAAPAPAAPAAPQQETWVVDPGDTLWAIALKHYGNANRWSEIYQVNQGVIEATARSRGYSSSDNGHWIFPGTVLVLP